MVGRWFESRDESALYLGSKRKYVSEALKVN